MAGPITRSTSRKAPRPRSKRGLALRSAMVFTASVFLLSALPPLAAQTMTAGAWLDKCKIFLAIRQGQFVKSDAATNRMLQACSQTAARVWCRESYVVIGAKLALPAGRERAITTALSKVCPHPLRQSHPVRYALEYWQQNELSQARRLQSAVGMLSEAFRKRWPQCLLTRKRLKALAPPDALARCVQFHTPAWHL